MAELPDLRRCTPGAPSYGPNALPPSVEIAGSMTSPGSSIAMTGWPLHGLRQAAVGGYHAGRRHEREQSPAGRWTETANFLDERTVTR
jgi:hypothetical protein